MRIHPAFQSRGNRPRIALLAYTAVAVVSGIGLFAKLDLFAKVSGLPGALLLGLCIAGLLAPFLGTALLRIRLLWAPLALAGVIFTIALIYPRVEGLHRIGRGSDQADCVIVAGDQLLLGNWPYQRDRLWSHNPMSCGPGWVALQAPLVRGFGYRGDLLAIWLLSLGTLTVCMGWKQVAGVVTLLSLSSGVWLALANGTDFLSFGVSIAALTILVDTFDRAFVWSALITSLVVQFRFPLLFLPLFMRARDSRRVEILASGFAAACFAGFLLWRPREMIADGPLFLFHKMGPLMGQSVSLPAGIAVIAAFFFGGLLLSLWLRRYLCGPWAVLCYMLVLFGIPAMLNLAMKLKQEPSALAAIRTWEGGMWLVACLPLAAVLVLREQSRLTERAARA